MAGDEANPCGRATVDSDMTRRSQAVGAIYTGAMVIDASDGNDGTSIDGRQMQHEAAAASTLWTSRAFSRTALQLPVRL